MCGRALTAPSSRNQEELVDRTAVQPPPEARSVPGDAAAVAARTLVTSELLCESVDLHAGERVLEVACGSGNAALAAARRFCRVVGVDRDPALLARARRRAEAEALEATFLEGGADDLPLPDGAFEVVLSACGAMDTPEPERTAGELLRVCRPGGRIGLVGWTPDGYVGELWRALGHLPAPLPWGDRERLRELLGSAVAVAAPRRSFLWWPGASTWPRTTRWCCGWTTLEVVARTPSWR
jgi:SAM-dependent methyltransferase